MVPPEYTDRILPGEAVYLAPNGRFHRVGCRYYVAPGPDAAFVEGTFTEAFLANSCKLCFPNGVQALFEPAPAPSEPAPTPSEPVPAPQAVASSLLEPPAEIPPVPAALLDERLAAADDRGARKRRKKQKLGNRPPAVTKVQVLIFVLVVGVGVGVFVALATLLHWFG